MSTVNRELYAVLGLLGQYGFEVNKPSHKLLFLSLLATGARPSEVIPSVRSNHVALLKKDIDLESNTVTVRLAELNPGRRDKVRHIRVSENLLRRVIGQSEDVPGPHVFPPNSCLSKLFDRILKRADIPKMDELGRTLTAHSFRHTFAT